METRVLVTDARKVGRIEKHGGSDVAPDDWNLQLESKGQDGTNLQLCADQLRTSDIPVAFPTETVYGLGADATRREAVKGIYKAKQRPSDNPLIVHFASLAQLRSVLRGGTTASQGEGKDVIPAIYQPLIKKFWPGPLTIILRNPPNSQLSPEVTAGLSTFGARMPRNFLALALIKLADRPIAAPSANASTKPSPTAAEHVLEDLGGRIRYILDGGPCDVGVESTVVDGLSHPPTILRPGGISIEQLRQCPGWEGVTVGYKDSAEEGVDAPRAPGMKYRHYSPKAKVVLYEAGAGMPSSEEQRAYGVKIGLITTKRWQASEHKESTTNGISTNCANGVAAASSLHDNFTATLHSMMHRPIPQAVQLPTQLKLDLDVWQINLGAETADVARGLFSALRELDRKGVEAILVEGIDELEGDVAAAVMNRLRKAAEVRIG